MNVHVHLNDIADPTGTEQLRRQFSSAMSVRWRKVEQSVRRMMNAQEQLHAVLAPTGDKVALFHRWLQDTIRQVVIGDGTWMQDYLRRASGLAQSDGPWLQTLFAVAGTELQGVADTTVQQAVRVIGNGLVANRPVAKMTSEVVSVLKNTGLARSKGVAEYMVLKTFAVSTLEKLRSEGHTRVGILPEKIRKPTVVGDAARKTVQKRGKNGRFVPYTKKISAKKQREAEKSYKLLRELPEVNVLTAEDDHVCAKCEKIADQGPYEIDHAMTLIPAHPNCRCIFLPVGKLPMEDGFNPDQPRDANGRWTDDLGYREDRRSNERFAQFRADAFKYDDKGLRGDSTATLGYRVPITIPVSLVADVPGRSDERRVPGDWQYDTLLEDVNKRGFTDETPIMVFVNPEGKPYINEGNTRVAIAKLKGVERISAWIDWKNGSHQVEGPWHPSKILPLAKRKITTDAFDPNQPRAPKGTEIGGRWVKQGDTPKYSTPDQRVFEVGGDEWNRSTARRLEEEYQRVKPELEAIADNAAGQMVKTPSTSWDTLPSVKQAKVEQNWKNKQYSLQFDKAYEHWKVTDKPIDVLKTAIHMTGWTYPVMVDYAQKNGKSYPFTFDKFQNAVTFHEATNSLADPSDPHQVKVTLDQYYLDNLDPEAGKKLTSDDLDELAGAIQSALPGQVKKLSETMEAPKYVENAVKWNIDAAWNSMSHAEKADYAHSIGAFEDVPDSVMKISEEAGRYDPLQERDGSDYRFTQGMAKYMFATRAQELIMNREHTSVDLKDIQKMDDLLWRGWVDSSTSLEGMVLQQAIAEEFQGRYRIEHFDKDALAVKPNATREEVQAAVRNGAKSLIHPGIVNYKDTDPFDIVKSLVRAKWETTQWMLDNADKPTLNLYRGVVLTTRNRNGTTSAFQQGLTTEIIKVTETYGDDEGVVEYRKLPDVHVERNGAASTSSDIRVANRWQRDVKGKVTLRAVVPRTAVISVPAYGKNAHNEKESVVMGTSWVGWDAWEGNAPSLDLHPLERR